MGKKNLVQWMPVVSGFPSDFDSLTKRIIRKVQPFTQTSFERIASLCEALKYICRCRIPGCIVECGVWKGGSMMAAALMLKELKQQRDIYLFDTFDGMTPPCSKDISFEGVPASMILAAQSKSNSSSLWNYVPIKAVKRAVHGCGYNRSKIHFVQGRVEDTLPSKAPGKIALLRLDTDWYGSTRHELMTLFSRISHGGVLIVDDYGHWKGARKAVDEYINKRGVRMMLHRIDYTGRIGVVP